MRTIQEISAYLKECFTANETIQSLYELNLEKTFDEQFSKVSIEAVLIYIFSSSVWVLEQMWESFKTETEQRIDDAYVTSLSWYYKKALDFQKGDALEFDSKTYSYIYPIIDVNKQIVKNVAIRQVTDENVTKLKVYFSDENKQPLSPDLRTSFETYMREIGAAGTHYLFVSEAPDPLRVHLRIYYDPLVLDSTGTRLEGGGKPVEETVESYLNALEYGGTFYASKLIDMIQTAQGVKDVELDGTTWQGTKENRRRIDAVSGSFAYEKNENDIIYSID
ncbi:hypothetical protein [Bacteroides nordii]|jgi:Tfp pilus assembly protein PilV|uniref:hypothetical protein n=1 Tax=Bacteroides nordii TaxID=291645 RepID=UPI0018AAEDC1|nr:hypothetical protein [Bacteroides nordii]